MNIEDKNYILNDILCEVKPIYLRKRICSRFIHFVENMIPEGSVVLTEEEYEGLQIEKDFNYGYYECEKNMEAYYENIILPDVRKQAVKEFIQAIYKEYELFLDEDEIFFSCLRKDIKRIAKERGVDLYD